MVIRGPIGFFYQEQTSSSIGHLWSDIWEKMICAYRISMTCTCLSGLESLLFDGYRGINSSAFAVPSISFPSPTTAQLSERIFPQVSGPLRIWRTFLLIQRWSGMFFPNEWFSGSPSSWILTCWTRRCWRGRIKNGNNIERTKGSLKKMTRH
jgi:hypothetical protein